MGQLGQDPGPEQRLGPRAVELHGFVAKRVRFDKRHFVGLGPRGQVGRGDGQPRVPVQPHGRERRCETLEQGKLE